MPKGFTLLEMLVVSLIIGILAAIALPQYQIAVGVSKVSNVVSFARVISDAQQRYYLANGSYTTAFDALDVSMPEGGTLSSDGKTMTYKNFLCYLRDAGDASSVYCNVLSPVGINMEKYYRNPGGMFICWPKSNDTTDLTNKICQNVSGQQDPNGSTSSGLKGYIF